MASCSRVTWNLRPCDLAVFVRLPLKAWPWWISCNLCLSSEIWSSSRPHLCAWRQQQERTQIKYHLR